MELVFVRHGQPERVVRHDGQPADPPLSDIGQQQAAAVAVWLAEMGIDALYSSPMRRAEQTARAISEATGLEPAVRDGLSEFDRDSPAYVPMEVLKETDRERWNELATGSFGDAERTAQFIAIVNHAVDQIVADHRSQRVALACHGGVVNAYLARCLGFDADTFLKIRRGLHLCHARVRVKSRPPQRALGQRTHPPARTSRPGHRLVARVSALGLSQA